MGRDTDQIARIQSYAYHIRRWSLLATSAAQSGHITSCVSAADIVAVLFFYGMRYRADLLDTPSIDDDRFILSKGHAAPLLYAVWRAIGIITDEQLLSLRRFDSVLEGHPSRRCRYTEAATGSLGQGLSIGLGYALYNRSKNGRGAIVVLLGDSECSEGSIWEAAAIAAHYKTSNLIALIDHNYLGQSTAPLDTDSSMIAAKWAAFGWDTAIVDGHSIPALMELYDTSIANTNRTKPLLIIANTIKGKGFASVEGKAGFHGKPFPQAATDQLLAELSARYDPLQQYHVPPAPLAKPPLSLLRATLPAKERSCTRLPDPHYTAPTTPRAAYGDALCALGIQNSAVIVLDAEVKNSTYTERFEQHFPERFYQSYIAEQNMIGMAVGLASCGAIPFASTFGAFITRAYDQLRMAAIADIPIRLMGSHAGISVGADGPSQMALEDISMIRSLPNSMILSPSDAISMYHCVALMADYSDGISYIRGIREIVPIIYTPDRPFTIGGCHCICRPSQDACASICIIATGITVFEAIKAHGILTELGIATVVIDCYSIQPLPHTLLQQYIRAAAGNVIVVEDHYPTGGLGESIVSHYYGILNHYTHLAVGCKPHSGTAQELRAEAKIDATAIVEAAQRMYTDNSIAMYRTATN